MKTNLTEGVRRILSDRRRRKGAMHARPGKGHSPEAFRWWHLFAGRKLFSLDIVGAAGNRIDAIIDVRMSGKQAGDFGMVHLYLDGRHAAASPLPAFIPVEGGVIEVTVSEVGLRNAQYLPDGGEARQLMPHPETAIGRRMQFERDHPVISRWVGVISIVLLVIGVSVNGLQLLEPLSEIPPIAAVFGSFESPIQLPLWLNIALAFGAGLGSTERALRLRFRWWLDGLAT